MNNIIDIINNNLCSGCGTCNVVCPKSAITLSFNSIGQLLPKINFATCIDCGLCYNYCPSLDKQGVVGQLLQKDGDIYGNILNVYIGKSLNNYIYKNSQSGGVATEILSYLFESELIEAAIVCRTEYSEEYVSKAVIITNKKDLLRCQKSSYTPVDMVSALNEITNFNSVAFVGTGCHIQGVITLKKNWKSRYSNIKYLIGLICDRTLCKTSTDILYGNYAVGKKKKLIWRDKSENYRHAKLIIEEESGKRIEIPSWKRHYLKQFFTSPRCLICFDKLNLGADITLGDPWGVSHVNWDNGESLIICRTLQGEMILNNMLEKKKLQLRTADKHEALKGQAIDKRLESIRRYFCIFEKKGWLTPQYFKKIKCCTTNNSLQFEEQTINCFLNDQKKEKHKLIQGYLRQLLFASIKKRINKFASWIIRK